MYIFYILVHHLITIFLYILHINIHFPHVLPFGLREYPHVWLAKPCITSNQTVGLKHRRLVSMLCSVRVTIHRGRIQDFEKRGPGFRIAFLENWSIGLEISPSLHRSNILSIPLPYVRIAILWLRILMFLHKFFSESRYLLKQI